MTESPEIIDNEDEGRFETTIEGHRAELIYRRRANRLILIHTEVPEELGGRGLGGSLVRAAEDRARAENLVLVPLCPFAAKWLRDHPGVAKTVEIDWSHNGE
ncbi:MAG: GNAT family N-acetyltransferase [Acidimicrobiales bacterium]